MTFRTRLLLIFTVAVVASVGLVEWLVSASTRERFERLESQRADALVAQFHSEYDRRGQEIARAVNGIAASDTAVNIAAAPDYSGFYADAASTRRRAQPRSSGIGCRRWLHHLFGGVAGPLRLQRRLDYPAI